MNRRKWLQVIGAGLMLSSLYDRSPVWRFDQRGFAVGALISASSFLTWKHTGTYIEVGRFGYMFNDQGKSRGGWIRNWAEDRESDWEQRAALLNEPIS